jgi:hypothetical protein
VTEALFPKEIPLTAFLRPPLAAIMLTVHAALTCKESYRVINASAKSTVHKNLLEKSALWTWNALVKAAQKPRFVKNKSFM